VPVDLREQIDVMRIERVVEIEHPVADMGEIGGSGGGLRFLVHAGLMHLRTDKETRKGDRFPPNPALAADRNA
uniref:hypothetical protein n=1 Tax=Stenotrophomonas sp. GbtcB23 TaxID=2824768 RepID=UPI001C306A00